MTTRRGCACREPQQAELKAKRGPPAGRGRLGREAAGETQAGSSKLQKLLEGGREKMPGREMRSCAHSRVLSNRGSDVR